MIREGKQERVLLEPENLITADIIIANYHGKKQTLWKRSMQEMHRRGFPCEVRALEVDCSSKEDMRKLKYWVNRLKNRD